MEDENKYWTEPIKASDLIEWVGKMRDKGLNEIIIVTDSDGCYSHMEAVDSSKNKKTGTYDVSSLRDFVKEMY